MMQTKLLRCALRLLTDRKGTSVMETAIVVPALAILVMGASDLAMGFSEKLKLQQAAARTVEMATAGGLNSAAFQNLQAEGASAAGVPTESVTLDTWLECNSVRQSSFDGTCGDGEQVARFVSIDISGSYAPMFSFLVPQSRTTDNGGFALNGYSSVRVQ